MSSNDDKIEGVFLDKRSKNEVVKKKIPKEDDART